MHTAAVDIGDPFQPPCEMDNAVCRDHFTRAGESAKACGNVERGSAKAERWRKVAQEAARQSGRADVPRIDEPAGWDAVFAVLRDEPARRGLLLDPEQAGLRVGQAARGARRVLIAIGPEGGFSVDERERAVRGGMLPVGLGT